MTRLLQSFLWIILGVITVLFVSLHILLENALDFKVKAIPLKELEVPHSKRVIKTSHYPSSALNTPAIQVSAVPPRDTLLANYDNYSHVDTAYFRHERLVLVLKRFSDTEERDTFYLDMYKNAPKRAKKR